MLAGAGVDELVADELTVLPGIEDLLALGEVRRLAETGPWEVVVVDCGPTAETLRLLGLPEAIAGYLERLFPAHRRAVRGLLAGMAGVGKGDADVLGHHRSTPSTDLAEQLAGLRAMLADHTRTSIRLVLTPRAGGRRRDPAHGHRAGSARAARSTASSSTGWCPARRRRCAVRPRAGCVSGTPSNRPSSRI